MDLVKFFSNIGPGLGAEGCSGKLVGLDGSGGVWYCAEGDSLGHCAATLAVIALETTENHVRVRGVVPGAAEVAGDNVVDGQLVWLVVLAYDEDAVAVEAAI